MAPRPILYPEVGALFVRLREAKGWNTNQAATIAKRKKLAGLSQNMLWSIETGRSAPSAETLKNATRLYDVVDDYPALAARVAAIVFGIRPEIISRPDLGFQTSDVNSSSNTPETKTHDEDRTSPEYVALLRRIRAEVSVLDLQFRRIDEAVAAAEVKAGITDRDDSQAIAHSESLATSARRLDRPKRAGAAR